MPATFIDRLTTANIPVKFFRSVIPLCILELSRLAHVEKAVKNTTIIVIYNVLVYIQMSQPTTCFGLF